MDGTERKAERMADGTNGGTGTLNRVRLTVETSRVQPHRLAAYHGETVALEVDFRNYGRPCTIDGGEAVLYWRSAADGPGLWHEAGADGIAGSVAAFTWGAHMDSGRDEVEWHVRATAGGAASYRGCGFLRLLPSPGFSPAVLPPARATLDFDLVSVLHAPYYGRGEVDAALAGKLDASATGDPADGCLSWGVRSLSLVSADLSAPSVTTPSLRGDARAHPLAVPSGAGESDSIARASDLPLAIVLSDILDALAEHSTAVTFDALAAEVRGGLETTLDTIAGA